MSSNASSDAFPCLSTLCCTFCSIFCSSLCVVLVSFAEAKSFFSNGVGCALSGRLLNTRPSTDCIICFLGVVRRFARPSSKACLFARGCKSKERSCWASTWSLERLDVAAATERKGELAALGTFPRGTLLLDMLPSLCGTGDNNVSAICKYAELPRSSGQVVGLLFGPQRDVLHVS